MAPVGHSLAGYKSLRTQATSPWKPSDPAPPSAGTKPHVQLEDISCLADPGGLSLDAAAAATIFFCLDSTRIFLFLLEIHKCCQRVQEPILIYFAPNMNLSTHTGLFSAPENALQQGWDYYFGETCSGFLGDPP